MVPFKASGEKVFPRLCPPSRRGMGKRPWPAGALAGRMGLSRQPYWTLTGAALQKCTGRESALTLLNLFPFSAVTVFICNSAYPRARGVCKKTLSSGLRTQKGPRPRARTGAIRVQVCRGLLLVGFQHGVEPFHEGFVRLDAFQRIRASEVAVFRLSHAVVGQRLVPDIGPFGQ